MSYYVNKCTEQSPGGVFARLFYMRLITGHIVHNAIRPSGMSCQKVRQKMSFGQYLY